MPSASEAAGVGTGASFVAAGRVASPVGVSGLAAVSMAVASVGRLRFMEVLLAGRVLLVGGLAGQGLDLGDLGPGLVPGVRGGAGIGRWPGAGVV